VTCIFFFLFSSIFACLWCIDAFNFNSEPTADDSVKTKVIEGKKGIVRKGTSGEALKKPKGSDSTSQKKDEKSNKITKKPSGGDNTKNMIVKKK